MINFKMNFSCLKYIQNIFNATLKAYFIKLASKIVISMINIIVKSLKDWMKSHFKFINYSKFYPPKVI